MATHLERFSRRRRVFLLEQVRVLQLYNLVATPHKLFVVYLVKALILPFFSRESHIFRNRLAVLLLPEPGDEDRYVVADAPFGLRPLGVEQVSNAVSGGLKD